MWLRNSWYVAAWSAELADRPLARTLLEQSIVLFRRADGAPAALDDACPHRHVPLSMGRCDAGGLRCGYHGLLFDADGRCVEAPSQSFAPPVRVRAYPVAERYGWIWVWMGEAAAADPSAIPDFGLLTSPDHAAVGKTSHVLAGYKLLIDNLMDLSHVGHVHTSTIGNAAFGGQAKLSVHRTERGGVEALRLVADVPPPPLYVKSGVLAEGAPIDRWSRMTFIPPCYIIIHTGGAPAGGGALEGDYRSGLNLWVMNAITPETATSTHYFWASVRAHALGDAAADALFLSGVSEAFEEDRRVLEAEQRIIGTRGDEWTVALKADAASIEARRVLDRLIRDEQAAAPAPAAAA